MENKYEIGVATFKHELKIAKENYQMATKFGQVVEYWNKKHQFIFFDYDNRKQHLFGDAKVIYNKQLQFTDLTLQKYLESYFSTHNKPHPKYFLLNKMRLFLKDFQELHRTDNQRFLNIISRLI